MDLFCCEGSLASDGTQAGMSVLEIRAGIALERAHLFKRELVVVDTAACINTVPLGIK